MLKIKGSKKPRVSKGASLTIFSALAHARASAFSINMQRKVFWISFFILGFFADVILPLIWAIIATIPILLLCWWLAYKSDWFD